MHYYAYMGYTPEYYERNKEKILSGGRKWRERYPEKMKEYLKAYAQRHPERIRERSAARYRKISLAAAQKRDDQKRLVLSFYGVNGFAKCTHPECFVEDLDVLCLDHVENNGAEERNGNKALSGTYLYRRLIKLGFPNGYQTLCANHNMKKEVVRRRQMTEEDWKKRNGQ